MPHPFLHTELAAQLDLAWPLIQAPMSGGLATPELVAAACNAGVLGSFGAAYLTPSAIDHALLQIKKLTTRPFGVNLFAPTATPHLEPAHIQAAIAATKAIRQTLGLADPIVQAPFQEDFYQQFEAVLKHRPAVFSFTFGLVSQDIIDACHRAGIITMGTATSVKEGIALQHSGVDAVVAQGIEAGGHRALFSPHQMDLHLETLVLTKLLTQALKIPVVASGGMMNGKDIAAAFMQGAQAVHLGTAFLLCDEAGTSAPYRDVLSNPQQKITRLTQAFSGRWARGIENQFMLDMETHQDAILPFPAQNQFTRDIRNRAVELNRPEYLSLWAGQGVNLIRKMPAAELVRTLHEETLTFSAMFR